MAKLRLARVCHHLFVTTNIIALSTILASGTVLEFDQSGDVTVTESQLKIRSNVAPNLPDPTIEKLRELTRDVASEFSGSVGVRKIGLDALSFITLFETLIQRESNFDPDAVSEAGAMGLGQLMPDTAIDMGVNDPFEPRSNLFGAAKFFTKQLDRFGSIQLALAAYNAGPERVVEYGGIPPFKETREYVAWVLNKAGIEDQAPEAVVENKPNPENELRKTSIEQPLKGEISVWEF